MKKGRGERTLADREVVFFSTSSPPVFPDFPFPPVDILPHRRERRSEEGSQLQWFERVKGEGRKVELVDEDELKETSSRERRDV